MSLVLFFDHPGDPVQAGPFFRDTTEIPEVSSWPPDSPLYLILRTFQI
jgi:hypothetical protein